jgi:hypothetical protein
MAELQPTAHFPGAEDIGIDLPVIVIDDDFFEFLQEISVDDKSMDVSELFEYWSEWEDEHVAR